MCVLIYTLIPAWLCFILGIYGQLVPSSTSIIPTGSTKSSCGAFNVMELCVRTNTEKQTGCVAFPDPRLCQCQYQQAVVTCFDLCKGDATLTRERSRAEADVTTLCQGYNSTQIFPPQQGNQSPTAPSLQPSKAISEQGVSTGLINSRSQSSTLYVELQSKFAFLVLVILFVFGAEEYF